jgi:hypothetical protein
MRPSATKRNPLRTYCPLLLSDWSYLSSRRPSGARSWSIYSHDGDRFKRKKADHKRREEHFEEKVNLERPILAKRGQVTVETTITAVGTKKEPSSKSRCPFLGK